MLTGLLSMCAMRCSGILFIFRMHHGGWSCYASLSRGSSQLWRCHTVPTGQWGRGIDVHCSFLCLSIFMECTLHCHSQIMGSLAYVVFDRATIGRLAHRSGHPSTSLSCYVSIILSHSIFSSFNAFESSVLYSC